MTEVLQESADFDNSASRSARRVIHETRRVADPNMMLLRVINFLEEDNERLSKALEDRLGKPGRRAVMFAARLTLAAVISKSSLKPHELLPEQSSVE